MTECANKLVCLTTVLLLALTCVGCSPKPGAHDWNPSSTMDDLSGVWVRPVEQEGDTDVIVIEGRRHSSYEYSQDRIDQRLDGRSGPVIGDGGVYFLADEDDLYSPYFYEEIEGRRFLIVNRNNYKKFVAKGLLEPSVLIRVADTLDFESPPERPSLAALGIPFDDPLASIPDER